MGCSKSSAQGEIYNCEPYIKKEHHKSISLHFKELEKNEETKCKASRRKAIIKGRDKKEKNR